MNLVKRKANEAVRKKAGIVRIRRSGEEHETSKDHKEKR